MFLRNPFLSERLTYTWSLLTEREVNMGESWPRFPLVNALTNVVYQGLRESFSHGMLILWPNQKKYFWISNTSTVVLSFTGKEALLSNLIWRAIPAITGLHLPLRRISPMLVLVRNQTLLTYVILLVTYGSMKGVQHGHWLPLLPNQWQNSPLIWQIRYWRR